MDSLKRPVNELRANFYTSPKKPKLDTEAALKPALPKEVTKLFKPLYCDLCKTQHSSPLAAAAHYAGKPHQKKVKQYLSQHFPELVPPEENIPGPKKKATAQEVSMSLTPDQAASCRICDVVFAGPIAAQSHYIGKKHRAKVLKGYTPLEPVAGMGTVDDGSGRFGIGESFRKRELPVEGAVSEPESARTVQKWYCDICDLQATDDTQYKAHLAGKKHQKNCKKINITPFNPEPTKVDLKPKDSILKSATKGIVASDDYSIYRTPSGNYYCKQCDCTVNSISQFTEHAKSKKHLRRLSNKT